MKGLITSVVLTFGLFCVFGGFSHWLSAQTTETESDYCAAGGSGSYVVPLTPASKETSELCFIQSDDVKSIEPFVLVDVSAQPQVHKPVANAIYLSSRQLKTKVFLRNKPLLIVAEPYKRYSLAMLCKELIQNGFQYPKILIGGGNSLEIVPVEDFIVEVSNFGAVVVATSQQVAQELTVLGIPSITVDTGVQLTSGVRKAVLDYSINGYLPVFVVGRGSEESRLKLQLEKEPLSDIYLVSGGVERIKSALKMSALSAVKRQRLDGVSSCGG